MQPRRIRTDPKRKLNQARLSIVLGVATLALVFATPALADPVVSGVSPSDGPPAGGTLVTISGTGLIATTEVDFGAAPANLISETNTTITVNAPPGTPGPVHVTVITGGVRSAATDSTPTTRRFPALIRPTGLPPVVTR
jgi:hypothetical protein